MERKRYLFTVNPCQFKRKEEAQEQQAFVLPYHLVVNEGQWINMIGKNGSGKSTLAQWLAGYQQNLYEGHVEQFRYTQQFPLITQLASQYILGSTLYEELVLCYEYNGVDNAIEKLEEKIVEVSQLLHIEHLLHIPLELLSGGQKQLVAIAGALLMDHKLIIVDEVTSMLSDKNRFHVIKVLRALVEQKQLSIIWITQHLDEINDQDIVWVIEDFRLNFIGSAKQLQLQQAKAMDIDEPHTLLGKERDFVNIDTALNAMPDESIAAIEIQHVTASNNTEQRISYTFQLGKNYVITGQNGIGKTTLLHLIVGQKLVAGGEIQYHCRQSSRRLSHEQWQKSHALRIQSLQYVGQHIEQMWFGFSIEDEINAIVNYYPYRKNEQKRIASSWLDQLERLGIKRELFKLEVNQLSVGEQKKAMLAICFLLNPDWLLLDEPLAGLDDATRMWLVERLVIRQAEGKSTIIISHQTMELQPCLDEMLLLTEKGLSTVERTVEALQLMNADPEGHHGHHDEGEAEDVSNTVVSDTVVSDKEVQHGEGKAFVSNTAESKAYVAANHANVQQNGNLAQQQSSRNLLRQQERAFQLKQFFHPFSVIFFIFISSIGIVTAANAWQLLIYGLLTGIIHLIVRKYEALSYRVLISYFIMSITVTAVGGLNMKPFSFDTMIMSSIMFTMSKILIMIGLAMPIFALLTPYRLQRTIEQCLPVKRKWAAALHQYPLLISIIYRMIPLMKQKWDQLRSIQFLRYKQKRWLELQLLKDVLLNYVKALLKLADQLATTLELRGFDQHDITSSLTRRKVTWQAISIRWRKQDSIIALIGFAILMLTVAIGRLL